MPLEIRGNRLVIEGDPRTAGLAGIRLTTGHKVLVQVIVEQFTLATWFSPIEQTLPPRILNELRALREDQKGAQAAYFEDALYGNVEAREVAASQISLWEQKLHDPLLCGNIRKGHKLTLWAPGLPDLAERTLEVGTVAGIEIGF